MATRRDSRVGATTHYAPQQVKNVVKSLGITVVSENKTHFACLCPFHGNRNTPAFYVHKHTGQYYCFNPDCNRYGDNLVELAMYAGRKKHPEAARFVSKRAKESQVSVKNVLDDMFKEREMPIFPQMKVDELKQEFWDDAEAQEYMHGRGFNNKTLEFFDVGFSAKQGMVVVPAHDEKGNPVGIIGRSIKGKYFKNSNDLPRNQILFNLHNARKHDSVVVTESSFDAMKVHQAGYPNVVALLGSAVSKEQISLFDRYFENVIIMTDADKAGRSAGRQLAGALRTKLVQWAVWEMGTVYPHDAKDAGDMTDDEISHVIENAVSDFKYWSYKGLQ